MTTTVHWLRLVFLILLTMATNLTKTLEGFYLAGNPDQEHEQQGYERGQQQERQKHRRQESSGNNIFSGFDVRFLAEAFGVSTKTAKKLQSQNDDRGNIVRVEGKLQVIRPPRVREEREQGPRGHDTNGLEETMCRLRENVDDPSRADVFSPQAVRISTLNSNNLPILSWLGLSAEGAVFFTM